MLMTKLSVNINKIATLRNARGSNMPDVKKAAIDCQLFGAHGITVHPRPDERHIRYSDVYEIKQIITTEFNIEGFPSDSFINLVTDVSPTQVTLVPDPPDAITSNQGWDTKTHYSFLKETIKKFKKKGIRVSLFMNPETELIKYAADTGADRIELYTEAYASSFHTNKEAAIDPYIIAAEYARNIGLGINAGHDLNLENLKFLIQNIPFIDEVSIGHALICDALYSGLENTIKLYINQLK